MTAMGADCSLEALLTRIRACRICLDSPDLRPIAHDPRPVIRAKAGARIAICGQAPGIRVHTSGKPFDDPSGVRLRSWLGMTPDEFYDVERVAVIPMGFCFPGYDRHGGDLPPRRECARTWRAQVFEQLPAIHLLLLIGSYAQRWHLGDRYGANMTETVRNWRQHVRHGGTIVTYALPHPSWRNNAWLRKNPWFEDELVPALKSDVRRFLCGK